MSRKIDAVVVSQAIRAVAETPQNRSVCSSIETFLVFKRMDVLQLERTIANADQVCNDLFLIFPDDENGRLRLRQGSQGRPYWGRTSLGARGTVWNSATRPTGAGLLFEPPLVRNPDPPHESHPFRADAANVIVESQPARNEFEPIDALAVILLRDVELDEDLDWTALIDLACEHSGLERAELEQITASPMLESLPLFSGAPWDSALLTDDLRPATDEREVGVVSDRYGSVATVIALRVDDRTRRMILLSILSTSAVLLVGPPGTGKTTLLAEIIEELRTSPEHREMFGEVGDPVWRTPDESWTSHEIVGGPSVVPGSHDIRFTPGVIPRAIEADRWVVLDEINRGDADRIFGALITWLSDRPVQIGQVSDAPDAKAVYLEWSDNTRSAAETAALEDDSAPYDVVYRAGRSWRLLGTYNGQDAQRVFRFGQALGRRFQQVPIPAMPPEAFEAILDELSSETPLPASADDRIAALYRAHFEVDVETRFGPAQFLKMRAYVAQGVIPRASDEDDVWGDVSEELVDELVSEGYLVTLGERLARLDAGLTESLRVRVVQDSAISGAQWEWIQSRLTDFA